MRIVVYFLLGLVVTPVLTLLLGWVLFGWRDTWNVGQGDSFLVFIVALWATPFGGVYWALVPVVLKRLAKRVSVGRFLLGSLALYVAALLVALLSFDRAYA